MGDAETTMTVGGMAQRLGRHSLTIGFSLTCTQSMVDRYIAWINCLLSLN